MGENKRKKFHDKDKYYRCKLLYVSRYLMSVHIMCYFFLFFATCNPLQIMYAFCAIVSNLHISLYYISILPNHNSGKRTRLQITSSLQTNPNQSQVFNIAKCTHSIRSMCRTWWMDTGMFSSLTKWCLNNNYCRGYITNPFNEECYYINWWYYHWEM